MMLKIQLIFMMCLLVAFSVQAEQGRGAWLIGVVSDASTGDVIPFVSVVLDHNGVQKGFTTSDLDGHYRLLASAPGTYDVTFSVVGYDSQKIQGLELEAGKRSYANIKLQPSDEVVD